MATDRGPGTMGPMQSLVPGQPRPWIIAHRGASADFPENTLAAFAAAAALSVDAMELDVQLSADGVPMVYHDRTLRKLGRPRRRVAGYPLRELKSLDAGRWFAPRFAGEPLATLDAVLERHGGRVPLMIEVKERGGARSAGRHRLLARRVADRVTALGLADDVFILCFGLDLLLDCFTHAPHLRYVWNLDAPPNPTPATMRRIRPLAALCCSIRTLDAAFVAWAHRAGKPVLSYTLNDPDAVAKAMHAGVDGLISDRPAWLAAYLEGGHETGR